MKASKRDHAHFAVIGAAFAADEDERIERAMATPPGERMLEGMRLGLLMPRTPEILAEQDARADGQMEIARRRAALGLGLGK